MIKIYTYIIILCLLLGCESDPVPSTPVSIENIEATSISYTSAIIKFSISGNTNKAGVTYGPDKELASAIIQYSDKASGSISISLENLNQGMEYFYSVFAEDKRGNKISSETKNFITKSSSITTGDALDVTTESAKLTMSFKGTDIDEAGIVYTTDALCKENLVTVSKANPTDSNLEFAINELDWGTTYYYKAFIKYNKGTIQYGEIKSFQTGDQFLKVSTTTIEAAAEGGTYQFEIEAKNVEWEILCESDWCDFDITSGTIDEKISFMVSPNVTFEPRTTKIYIKSKIDTLTIEVVQFESKDFNIYIEDANFKMCLIEQFDKNHDGEISTKEALIITELICRKKNIQSLKGIEYFENLTYLNCDSNYISNLDISKNINLKGLNCSCNNLTSLYLNRLLNLEYLGCGYNKIESLDLSNNAMLLSVWCPDNNLSVLDLRGNKLLTGIFCWDNQIKKMYIENCTELLRLNCYGNLLTELNANNNPDLILVWCSRNPIRSLSLERCAKLETLYCDDCDLYATLDIHNCILLKEVLCNGSPNLDELIISQHNAIEFLQKDEHTLIRYK